MVRVTGSYSEIRGRGRRNVVTERAQIARYYLGQVRSMETQVEPASTVGAPAISSPALNGVYLDGWAHHLRLCVVWYLSAG